VPAGGAARRPAGRRLGPFRGDDRVEFGCEQIRVAADQVEELLVDGPRGGVTGGCCGGHDRSCPFRR
jgi:hypothetical protein